MLHERVYFAKRQKRQTIGQNRTWKYYTAVLVLKTANSYV